MKILSSAVTLASDTLVKAHSLNSLSGTQSSSQSSFSIEFTSKQQMQSERMHFQSGGAARRSAGTKVPIHTQSVIISQQSAVIRMNLSVTIRQQLLVLERILRGLTGKLVPIYWFGEIAPTATGRISERQRYRSFQAFLNQLHETGPQQTSLIREDEQLNFNARGYFQTSDGKSVRFDCDLNLRRTFVSRNSQLLQNKAILLDPLVINFNSPATDLTQSHFNFDLDCDGEGEEIPFATGGSGFLGIDQNQDGKINDGSELFGPTGGDGFAELAAYDGDGNGWIDANDPVFDRLRIWTKDASGRDQLFALGQKGVGAIFLGSVAAPFTMKESQNSTVAVNRDAGIFTREDGSVGTIQQLDLALPGGHIV